jgi:hypothetical protein
MTHTIRRSALGTVLALAMACGGPDAPSDPTATAGSEAAASQAVFTGNLTVSSTDTTVGSPITVTESATNLTGSQVGPIIVGIRRLGFNVVAVQKPRTGICRIAGSATCNFLELAPFETQTYTLTLVATAPGTYQIQGWTTSSYVSGGFSGSVTVTVH